MRINAEKLEFKELNELIKQEDDTVTVDNCAGQRFIGAGREKGKIVINGTPGNALGAYLDGAEIEVHGNAQDAVGDTMNEGRIIIHGNVGDALGYAMRGGKIYVKGNSGYRTGIHMKEYGSKKPVIVIGGAVGSFLGEYLAGGVIIVLGLYGDEHLLGNFTGTGMHGGKIFIRSEAEPQNLPAQVLLSRATDKNMEEIEIYLREYADTFSLRFEDIAKGSFYVLEPNAKNPYTRLYTPN